MFLSENNPDIIIKIPYFWAQAAKRSVGIILRAHAFGPLADDIARALLCLEEDLADIFPDDAQGDQLDAAQQRDGDQGAGPARHRPARNPGDQGVKDQQEGDHGDEHADARDDPDRLDRKAGNAVKGKRQHL